MKWHEAFELAIKGYTKIRNVNWGKDDYIECTHGIFYVRGDHSLPFNMVKDWYSIIKDEWVIYSPPKKEKKPSERINRYVSGNFMIIKVLDEMHEDIKKLKEK
jgi:hypothetical protein